MSAKYPHAQAPPKHQAFPIADELGPIAPQELWRQLSPLQQQQVRLTLTSISQQWLAVCDCHLIPEETTNNEPDC